MDKRGGRACSPAQIHLVEGSEEENERLLRKLKNSNTLVGIESQP